MREDTIDRLTHSERECLRLALTRLGSKEIAPLVGLTHHTVDKRFKSAIRKLGASSRFDAARMLADYERGSPGFGPDQSPDPLDQGPDLLPLGRPANSRRGYGEGETQHGAYAAGELREEQMPFFYEDFRSPGTLALPLRLEGGKGNDLSVWQRVGWIVAIGLLAAIAFGVLSSGLMSLGKIAQSVAASASDRNAR